MKLYHFSEEPVCKLFDDTNEKCIPIGKEEIRMTSPILNKLGAAFIPVSDLHKARDWYSTILGVEVKEKNLIDHLYIMPMNGAGVVLDSNIYSAEKVFKVPAFHFNTYDIEASYQFMKEHGVELLTGIENGHWFNFKDPDGNVLMICKC